MTVSWKTLGKGVPRFLSNRVSLGFMPEVLSVVMCGVWMMLFHRDSNFLGLDTLYIALFGKVI